MLTTTRKQLFIPNAVLIPTKDGVEGKDFDRETALARALCSQKGMKIATDGVGLLGGHGYVKEHPVERWYRDVRAAGMMEGALLV